MYNERKANFQYRTTTRTGSAMDEAIRTFLTKARTKWLKQKIATRLFLFNSGFAPLYFRNVLNTLAFPAGTLNEYRYDKIRVHDTAEQGKVPPGTACTIVYVDRWANGAYEFVPLRHGILRNSFADGNRRHFQVELDDYPSVASTQDEFRLLQDELREAWKTVNPPHLTNDKPEETNDGNYAFVSTCPLHLLEAGSSSDDQLWENVVGRVAQTKAYLQHMQGHPVFTRQTVTKEDGRAIATKSRGKTVGAAAKILRNRRYSLEVTYRFPGHEDCKERSPVIDLAPTENIRLLDVAKVPLDAPANRVRTPFSFRRFTDEEEGSIRFIPRFEAAGDDESKPLIAAAHPIIFRASIPKISLVWLLLAIVLFGIGSLFVGLDSDVLKDAWETNELTSELWLKGIATLSGAIGQAIAAVIAIRVFGKSFL